MKPSQYMFQMSMNTEQKLANMHTMSVPKKLELLDMSETSHQKHSTVSIDDPMFQPFPSEIVFQNYTPFETYEVPLVLRNNDKVESHDQSRLFFQSTSALHVGGVFRCHAWWKSYSKTRHTSRSLVPTMLATKLALDCQQRSGYSLFLKRRRTTTTNWSASLRGSAFSFPSARWARAQFSTFPMKSSLKTRQWNTRAAARFSFEILEILKQSFHCLLKSKNYSFAKISCLVIS